MAIGKWTHIHEGRPPDGLVVALLGEGRDKTILRAIGRWDARAKDWVITAAPEGLDTIYCWCELPDTPGQVRAGDIVRSPK
jgi:hypothetical protein